MVSVPLTGFDTVLVVDDTFDIFEMSNGVLSQKFNSSLSASSITPVTATILADVQYINRANTVPVHRAVPAQLTSLRYLTGLLV